MDLKLTAILIVGLTLCGNHAKSKINYRAEPLQTQDTLLSSDITIEGKIIDSSVNALPNKESEVRLRISNYPFNYSRMGKTIHKVYSLKVKYNQPFKFVLPNSSERIYMVISYELPRAADYWSGGENVYILQKGDRINCLLSNDIYIFSGKGSEKLNCQSEIYKVQIKYNGTLLAFMRAKSYSKYHEEMDRRLDSCLLLRKAIIEKHRPKLGKDLSDIMLANCYGMRYLKSLQGGKFDGDVFPESYDSYINSEGFKNINQNTRLNLDQKILVAAPIYTDFLFEKIMMETRIYVDDKLEQNTSPDHIKRVYNAIIKNYSGVIKDKLIATFFIQWQTIPTIFDYLDESLSIVNDAAYRKILLDIKQKYSKGTPFYAFELEDTNGKLIRLQDFNDKVVIIDFWYTGCPGCAVLKKQMKGVWETYKNNPSVNFVSISIDKDIKTWKESVLSKRYTEPDAINLYTGGKGKTHSIISELRIQSYPRMFLLKGGKIYSAIVPWPSGPDTTKGTTKEFIDLIEEAVRTPIKIKT